MKVLAINGSPRKEWNTALLLQNAIDGSASTGAETEMIHLSDLNFKGCRSCFLCKKRGGQHYGYCVVKDDLTAVLNKISHIDALILGSPIYFGSVSSEMRSFIERVLFPNIVYADPFQTIFPGTIKTGFIYTMNMTEKQMKESGLQQHLDLNESFFEMAFGSSESLFCNDTYQFKDYSKVVQSRYDPEKKAERRKNIFPKDCEKAFDMGRRFAIR